MIKSVPHLVEEMGKQQYIVDTELATAIYLSLILQKPLLVEGEPGCGKTEISKILANIVSTDLIRLQCYEGIDANQALYEWNYPKQLLAIRMSEGHPDVKLGSEIFSDEYLLKRPLLSSIMRESNSPPPVLLIDEIDRADEEFEGLLLEFLSDFQISIPERGTIKAKDPPIVIITSNRTRDLSDALRRRCIYAYVGYPSLEKEFSIVKMKVPELGSNLSKQICSFMQNVRNMPTILKKPGVSETLDWARALLSLDIDQITEQSVRDTISCIVKTSEDKKRLGSELNKVLK